jgi:hypothetical protein
MSAFDPTKIEWREPWGPIPPNTGREIELQREMCAGHVLFGRSVIAVAARNDCDDVLFYLGESAPSFAVVHLTYRRETQPEWPHTELFDSLSEWIQKRMIPDAEEFDL